MVFGPDSTTLYIGMRTPLVPMTNRTNAVIAPIKNFETWFNNGAPSGSPTYGNPIELNLGGRGIRDLVRLSNGTYIILAGNVGGSPVTGAIYKWTGNAKDTPAIVNCPAGTSLNMEGAMQVNVNGSLSLTDLQVITDKGDDILYNDGTEAKDFSDLIYRKFRSDILSNIDLSNPPVNTSGIAQHTRENGKLNIYPNPSYGLFSMQFYTPLSEVYTVRITDINGKVVYEHTATSAAGMNHAGINIAAITKGIYIVYLNSASMNYTQKLVLQ
jgi:hypothetical protein